MNNINEVKKLYDAGFSLMYLRPKSKRPFENEWTKTPNRSWSDLKHTFKPDLNVGVRLGEFSHIDDKGYLACIDVDIKDFARRDDALLKLREITGGKKFPTVMSGSGQGSRHLYCVTKEPFKMITIAKEKGFEICLYSTGRQMVLPPSIHPSGKPYVWKHPFTIDEVPVIEPSKFKNVVEEKQHDEIKLDFKAEDVDLYKSKLSLPIIQLIEDGRGCTDRSASLFSAALAMCRAKFSDNQILSVLSNPDHFLASAAYEHTQSTSRARAVKWLNRYTLSKARYETDIMRRFDNPPPQKEVLSVEETKEQEREVTDDNNKLIPDLDGKGKPKNTLKNIVHILEHKLGGGVVGLNQFSNRVSFLKDTPYGGVKGKELTDQDDLNLKHYLATHYRFEPGKELCYEAHAWIAHKYAFHPVRSYLEGLTWDNEPRLDQWLKSAFKAIGPREYIEAVGRKVLTAAVARVYEPGIKFDHVMIIEGLQGKGKSTALRMLAGDQWFTDSLGDIHQKDVVDQMCGKWIIEIAELATFKGKDAEALKSFITRQQDRVRMPYGRRSADFPRQGIFIGSTNNHEYLADESGNRRYWPVTIEQTNFAWLRENRDQLWAEAKVRYDLGEDIWLSKEVEDIAFKEQEKRFAVDEWEDEIKKYIGVSNDPTKFTTIELWRGILQTEGIPSDHEAKRIAKVMRRLGYEKRNHRIGGVQHKIWVQK